MHRNLFRGEVTMEQKEYCAICSISISPHDPEKKVQASGRLVHTSCETRRKIALQQEQERQVVIWNGGEGLVQRVH